MTYLEAINRLLRQARVLTGDDDNLTAITSTQHQTTSNLAQLAIQTELSELASILRLPRERAEGNFTSVQSQRVNDLAADFEQFYGRAPHITGDNAIHDLIFMFPGGFDELRMRHREFKTQEGRPRWWYFEENNSTTKQIGLFPVPDADTAGEVFRYFYETQKVLSAAADVIPFQDTMQDEVFVSMAARRFEFMFNPAFNIQELEQDGIWSRAKSTMVRLLKPRQTPLKYGRRHG